MSGLEVEDKHSLYIRFIQYLFHYGVRNTWLITIVICSMLLDHCSNIFSKVRDEKRGLFLKYADIVWPCQVKKKFSKTLFCCILAGLFKVRWCKVPL